MQSRHAPTAAIIAFAIALWLGATLALLGQTGKFSDDYIAHFVHPVNGFEWAQHPWARWDYFWRPLHLLYVYVMNTVSWHHDWIGHAALALVHLGVSGLLFRAMRRLGIGALAAGGSALLFLTCPLLAEATLWTSASCNAISCLFLLWLVMRVHRHADRPVGWRHLAIVFVLAFVTPCWYEPAAGAFLTLPLAAAMGLPSGLECARRWKRIWLPTASAGAACVLYVVLLVVTAPGGARGGSASIIPMQEWPGQAGQSAWQFVDATMGGRAMDVYAGGISLGVQTIREGGAAWWLIVLVPTALWAGVWVLRRLMSTHGPEVEDRAAPLRAIGLGLLIAIGSMVPVVVVWSAGLDLRTLYVPLLGLMISGAAGASCLAAKVRVLRSRWACAGALGVVGAGAIAAAVACIGFQAGFRAQAELDRSIARQLVERVPDPASKTVFLPLAIEPQASATGRAGFDEVFRGGFELPAMISSVLRHAYGRTDVSGIGLIYRLNGDVPIRELRREGFEIRRSRGGLANPVQVRWERVRPFVVDRDGRVRLVGSMRVQPLEGEGFEVSFPGAETGGPRVRLTESSGGRCVVKMGVE